MLLSEIFEGFLPITEMKVEEVAPDAPGAEDWIESRKADFKKRYGDAWERVLYGKAWKMFGDKAKNKR